MSCTMGVMPAVEPGVLRISRTFCPESSRMSAARRPTEMTTRFSFAIPRAFISAMAWAVTMLLNCPQSPWSVPKTMAPIRFAADDRIGAKLPLLRLRTTWSPISTVRLYSDRDSTAF